MTGVPNLKTETSQFLRAAHFESQSREGKLDHSMNTKGWNEWMNEFIPFRSCDLSNGTSELIFHSILTDLDCF